MDIVYKLNGQDITGQAFIDQNNFSYPSNWCDIVSDDDLSRVGIKKLTIVYPPLSDNCFYDGSYIDSDTERTYNIITEVYPPLNSNEKYSGYTDSGFIRTYNIVPKTTAEINNTIQAQIDMLQQQQILLAANVIMNVVGAGDALQASKDQIVALQATLINQ